jgi:hypothetical protein
VSGWRVAGSQVEQPNPRVLIVVTTIVDTDDIPGEPLIPELQRLLDRLRGKNVRPS